MNNARTEIKKLVAAMENLAHEIQLRLSTNKDILTLANELVRNNSTFVFTLGEMYALDQIGSTKTVSARKVSGPSTTSNVPRNRHSVRDSLGRFTSKV